MEWFKMIAGTALLLCGLLIFLIEMYGVFHLKYVLNRMHAAALGDTLGIGCSMAGLMILSGPRLATLKMALIVVFLWFASPVSSHLLARLETSTNEQLKRHCEILDGLPEPEEKTVQNGEEAK